MLDPSLLLPDPLTPEALERRYRELRSDTERAAFKQAIEARYAQEPDNLLLAAWHARLMWSEEKAPSRPIAWTWAVPLAILNGLLLWVFSDDRLGLRLPGETYIFMPAIILYWMPVSAAVMLLYLAAAGEKAWRRAALGIGSLVAGGLYVYAAYTHMAYKPATKQYLILMALHLPVLALVALGFYLLFGRDRPEERFALLVKMLEGVFLAGIFVLVAGVLVSISGGLFTLFSVDFPDWLMRLALVGGGGMVPILVAAMVYDPTRPPSAQPFDEGLGKVMRLVLQVALPVSLLVLVVYVALIPFHAREPLYNRDALIVYTAMLFGVMALLLGVTPVREQAGTPWVHRGMLALVVLALLVGGYALYALLYRTWRGMLTPNRLAFVGWDVLNVGLLAWLLVALIRKEEGTGWVRRVQRVFARGAGGYALWALLMLLTIPWAFGRPPGGAYAHLPPAVQEAIYGRGYPILLKCYESPHIYLLERGQKRWIKDIPTFEAEGFRWDDVRMVSCEALRQIPDGPPIPPGAGPPPTLP